jgi:phosphate transport system protein
MSDLMRDKFDWLKMESARMAGSVQRAVADGADSLLRGDVKLAREVMLVDDEIDQSEVAIEQSAIDLLSLYRPVAGEFRQAIMTLRINSDLERIADCAGNVAGQVASLVAESQRVGEPYGIIDALQQLASDADELTRRAVRAYNLLDAGLAEQVIGGDARLDALYGQVLQDADADLRGLAERRDRHLPTIMAAKNLERIGDHCTNVAEATLYIARGQMVRHRHLV